MSWLRLLTAPIGNFWARERWVRIFRRRDFFAWHLKPYIPFKISAHLICQGDFKRAEHRGTASFFELRRVPSQNTLCSRLSGRRQFLLLKQDAHCFEITFMRNLRCLAGIYSCSASWFAHSRQKIVPGKQIPGKNLDSPRVYERFFGRRKYSWAHGTSGFNEHSKCFPELKLSPRGN